MPQTPGEQIQEKKNPKRASFGKHIVTGTSSSGLEGGEMAEMVEMSRTSPEANRRSMEGTVPQRMTKTDRRFSFSSVAEAYTDDESKVYMLIVTKGMVKVEHAVDESLGSTGMLSSIVPPLSHGNGNSYKIKHAHHSMNHMISRLSSENKKHGIRSSPGEGKDGSPEATSLHGKGAVLGEMQMISRESMGENITVVSDVADYFWLEQSTFDDICSKYAEVKWNLIRATSVHVGANLLSKDPVFSSWKRAKLLPWVERNAHVRILAQYEQERREEWSLEHVTILVSGKAQAYGAQPTSVRDMSQNEELVAPCVLVSREIGNESPRLFNFGYDAIILEVYDSGLVSLGPLSQETAVKLAKNAHLPTSSSNASNLGRQSATVEERQAEWMINAVISPRAV